jgi:hypothetical protein
VVAFDDVWYDCVGSVDNNGQVAIAVVWNLLIALLDHNENAAPSAHNK